MVEKRYRSLIKTVSWRVIATLATTIIAYLLTGTLKVAVSIGVFEFFSKLLLYYWHERLWARLKFGLVEKYSDYQI